MSKPKRTKGFILFLTAVAVAAVAVLVLSTAGIIFAGAAAAGAGISFNGALTWSAVGWLVGSAVLVWWSGRGPDAPSPDNRGS